jgi:hypothetical protein
VAEDRLTVEYGGEALSRYEVDYDFMGWPLPYPRTSENPLWAKSGERLLNAVGE